MDHDDYSSIKSTNRPFEDVLDAYQSRRRVLRGGLEAAVATFFASPVIALANGGKGRGKAKGRSHGSLIDFTPVPLEGAGGAMPRIAEEYEFQVFLLWGDPINPSSGPAFNWPPTAEDQAQQIGIGHDGMWFFPLNGSNERGVLVMNHEYGSNSHTLGLEGFAPPENPDQVRVSQHGHGISVVEVANLAGKWQHVDSSYARRIHLNTPVEFSGPAAGSPLLDNPGENPPAGTLNNCANGYTPWGTYLTCEENAPFYFGTTDSEWQPTELHERYGYAAVWAFFYGWAYHDPRFDLASPEYVNETNRFGWVVEIDPMNPYAKPVKRTALGRFKHEGVAVVEGRGKRIVGYMGDDEQFEYIYKFVSEKNWKALRAQGMSPLDHGTLYAAKFNDDGTGEWLELSLANPAVAAEFNDQAAVVINARKAADLAGATPMDRAEWTTVAPNGDVYCTLTNNSAREETGPGSPRAPNPHGHIVRWRDSDQHVGTTFVWDIFAIADETHGTNAAAFGSPDGLWADPDGRLFIQTDGSQPHGLNDQLLVADSTTGDIRRLFEAVPGCEVTGVAVTPDRRTLFVNVQHPGNGDPAVSNFPYPFDGVTIPRDATVAIRRKDGGIVGS